MLVRLTQVDRRYAFYDDAETDGPGSLILEDENGDTHLPRFGGTWTILEEARDRWDAVEKARAWKEEEKP